MVENGIYIDDCEGLHPDIISRYYGTHGDIQSREDGDTGAGNLLDEDIPTVGPDVEIDKDDWQELGRILKLHKLRISITMLLVFRNMLIPSLASMNTMPFSLLWPTVRSMAWFRLAMDFFIASGRRICIPHLKFCDLVDAEERSFVLPCRTSSGGLEQSSGVKH